VGSVLRGMVAVVSLMLASQVALGEEPPIRIDLPRQGFEQVARTRGVVVYKNNSSDVIWIGAVGIIPAPPEKVFQALLEYDRQAGTIARVSEATVLSHDENSLFVYERLNLPIISDRDFVLRVTHGQDLTRRWIRYQAVNDQGPAPRHGIVRVTRNTGAWELVPTQGGNATIARCEFRINLGGMLPLWMAKSRAGSEIPQLYSDICKLSLGSGKAGACP
jgi:hypothetical protein